MTKNTNIKTEENLRENICDMVNSYLTLFSF